jgi:hypothetical protein
MRQRGLPTSAVTAGGEQEAPDGGLDVRVALPPSTVIDGYVSRPATGFQAKKSDMPRKAIGREMRPKGKPSSPCQITNLNLSGPRGPLQSAIIPVDV